MNKSSYFESLSEAYGAEIDDLFSDSEGKNVLNARLKDKRSQLDALLQMIEFSPEMVIPVFYQAFRFGKPGAIARAAACEPDDDDFPAWADLATALNLESWANPFVDKALAADGGDRFMVSAAVCEYLRQFGSASAPVLDETEKDEDADDADGLEDDDHFADLGEAGADWLGEQGFDSHHS